MADPYTTPIPGSSSYETATLAAKTAYDSALTRLNQQRGDTLRQYGYSSSIDPTSGVVSNVQVDANLPYGQFQQERKSHADQYQATRDASQARGLGHGGLAAASITNLRGGFGAEDAALGSGLTSQLSNFQDQQNQSAYSRDAALYRAEQQKAQDAIDAQRFNAAQYDYTGGDQTDWATIIAQLLGGDGGGNDATNTTPPGATNVGTTPAPNSNASGAAIKLLLNPPVKKPVAKKPTVASQAYVPGGASVKVAKAIVAAAKPAPKPAPKKKK